AGASSDPQGQALTYAFDFGDGTTLPAQASPTATHSYPTAGAYTVTVTVTNTSGLSATAQQTVTATAPQPPVAQIGVTPTSGIAPLAVTADAGASTDPQGQTLTYAFDFGDGTTLPAQASPTANHTYAAAGAYTVTVAVTNTSGLSATARQTVTASPAPAWVALVGTTSATSSKSSAVVTVAPAAGVRQGDLLVVSVQIATKSNGAVSATDSAGNTYTVVRDVAVSGGRLVVLSGRATNALAPNAKITASFPGSSTSRMVVDELTGVTRVDRTAAATGTTAAFSSGLTATTTSPREVVLGVVAAFTSSTNPTWGTSWTALGPLATGATNLGRAYQLPTTTGTYRADGTTKGTWAALVMTFQP
ncbi:PKD domain-containing protein, partial [Intrasporangium oryzae]|uniref:PKD domain-containing protein n=1 Tax=Intrasporangium oryzae TaxID=412687 RepID=UPI0012FA002E